jgi:hypothetical protein
MSCSFTEKISSLIDGELAAVEARAVERHVLTCAECEQVRADFLSLRSEIAGFETTTQAAIQNRELKKILSRGERVPASGLRWGWSTPAIAFATLLVFAVIGFVLYQGSPNTNPEKSVAQVPSPIPSATPSPTIEKNNEPVPEESPKETKGPERTPSTPSAPAPKKSLPREPKPGEQFALNTEPAPATDPTATPERVRPADTQTLTAIHFEKSETLLVSFRNVRLDTRESAAEVAYERKRAQQLVMQNMILRREADAKGDVQTASLLENLEPILLDIANLPDKPDSKAVRTIRERVDRKNIVPLLQINSAALARALDD